MKESISYTFLLNIVILFIVVCAAIIAGIFSYNRAFRASTIIAAAIEKYEGFNCLSKEEIARKLQSISYNTPFEVNCNSNDGKCEAQSDLGYKVIATNLDFDANKAGTELMYTGKNLAYDENMNSVYYCTGTTTTSGISSANQECITNKHYQFGIYTYMYVDVPVISKILRIPLYTKTSTLYDFRNYHVIKKQNSSTLVDATSTFDNLYIKKYKTIGKYTGTFIKDSYLGTKVITEQYDDGSVSTSTKETAMDILSLSLLNYYTQISSFKKVSWEYIFMNITNDAGNNYRTRIISERIYHNLSNSQIARDIPSIVKRYGVDGQNEFARRECGFKPDYSEINN